MNGGRVAIEEDGDGHVARADSGGEAARLTKRGVLKRVGAAAVGLSGLAGGATTATAHLPVGWRVPCIEGEYTPGGSHDSVDVVVVNTTDGEFYTRDEDVFRGFCDGFGKLYESGSWLRGYRIQYRNPGYVFEAPATESNLRDALAKFGYTNPRHYHVVYPGDLGFGDVEGSLHGGGWNGDGTRVSGLSLATTIQASPYVRGLHQALHAYIDDSVARDVTGLESASAYDAKHALGTIEQAPSGEWLNTIMADVRPSLADRGCVGTSSYGGFPREHVLFSECTVEALSRSSANALDSE